LQFLANLFFLFFWHEGDNSVESVLSFLEKKVHSTVRGMRKVKVHRINCLDKASVEKVVNDIETDIGATYRKRKPGEGARSGAGATALRGTDDEEPSRYHTKKCCSLM